MLIGRFLELVEYSTSQYSVSMLIVEWPNVFTVYPHDTVPKATYKIYLIAWKYKVGVFHTTELAVIIIKLQTSEYCSTLSQHRI